MIETWITVYFFTLVECVAPAGKTVCEREDPFEFVFLDSIQCSLMLDKTIASYIDRDRIILVEEPVCRPRSQRVSTFDSKEELDAQHKKFPTLYYEYRSGFWTLYKRGE